MSFSSDVKEELSKEISPGRHCQIAELTAILIMECRITSYGPGQYGIRLRTENAAAARKFCMLVHRAFHVEPELSVRAETPESPSCYFAVIARQEDVLRILKAARLVGPDGKAYTDITKQARLVVLQTCCRRAFIRGAFLAAGSISDPNKSYHLEIICAEKQIARLLEEMIRTFGITARTIERKGHFVVYIKESSGIVDMLGIMEASVALMNLENVRIYKEMRNSVNRGVNCETSNIRKTVSAAVKQTEDIRYIRESAGYSELPEGLREIAELRLAYPEATLKELGEMLDPPVGKSGVNHRLRRISEIADRYRFQ